ncbi:MAG: Asp-tRNA(Asn)/Glu-tRNA(Gln) amidotransferase subunit GatC [Methyloligellaceae bacterium]
MKVDEATVRHIAQLARLKVTDSEMLKLSGELTNILRWVEQLNEVDTDKIDAGQTVVENAMTWRSDEVNDGGYPEDIVRNAPEHRDHYFVVPKVVE